MTERRTPSAIRASPDQELSHLAAPHIRPFADLASHVLATPARLGPVRLVAVDGPAGSGKSTFARRLAGTLHCAGASTVELNTDDLLDGWTDLVTFWPRLEEGVLIPLAAGRPGAFHAYDWYTGRFRQELTLVQVPEVLVIEGVSSARAAVRNRLTLAVHLVAPREMRLSRGLARDGEALRPEWLRWMEAEDAHFASDPVDPSALLVDGAPAVPHDEEREYVEVGDDRMAGV